MTQTAKTAQPSAHLKVYMFVARVPEQFYSTATDVQRTETRTLTPATCTQEAVITIPNIPYKKISKALEDIKG